MKKEISIRLTNKRLKSYKVLSNEGLISKDDRKKGLGVSFYFKSSVSDERIKEFANYFYGHNDNVKMRYTLGYVIKL